MISIGNNQLDSDVIVVAFRSRLRGRRKAEVSLPAALMRVRTGAVIVTDGI